MRVLDASFTHISNLEPLKNLINLEHLCLFSTNVSDLKSLKDLTNLQFLILDGTQISNLESLKGLKNLKGLQIQSCKNITDNQVEELQKALPKLSIIR